MAVSEHLVPLKKVEQPSHFIAAAGELAVKNVKRSRDAQGKMIYTDASGKKLDYLPTSVTNQILEVISEVDIFSKNIFDQIEVDVTDSRASSATTLFDGEGRQLPKGKSGVRLPTC